jgi:hypothetical protein
MPQLLIIAAIVFSCLYLAIWDMKNVVKDHCSANADNDDFLKEIFVDKDGFIHELESDKIPDFKLLHAGEYEDMYEDVENVTITE